MHGWLRRQLDDKLVERNSALGDAINYLLKRWEPLTLFLRKAGAPLDNNLCERALKNAILHRKNSMFYKTRNGARVGDMYMSLIYTCEKSARHRNADPFGDCRLTGRTRRNGDQKGWSACDRFDQ